MISKEDVRTIATEVVREHHDSTWTEERARQVATIAAGIAVKQITDNFYMSVGRKTVATIGAAVVVGVIAFKDYMKDLVGLK